MLFLKLAILVWLLGPASAAAFYNPKAGRWLNRDPIEESGGRNLYAIAGNEVVSMIDTSGQVAIKLPLFPPVEIPWPGPPISLPPLPLPPGVQPPDGLSRVLAFMSSAMQCKQAMEEANKLAEAWVRNNAGKYKCCVNGKNYRLTDFPGPVIDPPCLLGGAAMKCTWGVPHCVAGYYARTESAGPICLAAANLAHELKEFLTLGEWLPWYKGLDGWLMDTVSDIAETYVGHGYAETPEDCVPAECQKIK